MSGGQGRDVGVAPGARCHSPRRSRALDVHERTIDTHISSIFTKLDLIPTEDDHRRVLAVLTWLRG